MQQVLEQMGFKEMERGFRHLQGTYFSVSLDFRASSLKVNSQAGLPCQGREPAMWLEVCVCVCGGVVSLGKWFQ